MNGHSRPFFLYFHLLNTIDSKCRIIFCWWLDSNRRPLELEATLVFSPAPLALFCIQNDCSIMLRIKTIVSPFQHLFISLKIWPSPYKLIKVITFCCLLQKIDIKMFFHHPEIVRIQQFWFRHKQKYQFIIIFVLNKKKIVCPSPTKFQNNNFTR